MQGELEKFNGIPGSPDLSPCSTSLIGIRAAPCCTSRWESASSTSHPCEDCNCQSVRRSLVVKVGANLSAAFWGLNQSWLTRRTRSGIVLPEMAIRSVEVGAGELLHARLGDRDLT